MEQIKDTLQTIFKDLSGKKTKTPEDNPEGWLKKILTKRELGHIKFYYFKKGILGLKVDSSAWMYNFNLKKETLITQLQQYSKEIKDIRFKVGDMK